MIPDKIYLGVGPLSGNEPGKKYIYAEWMPEPYPSAQNIEYIRKDALLEWAEKEKFFAGQIPTEYMKGQHAAFKRLIDKLNTI